MKLIKYASQNINNNDVEYVGNTLKKNFITQGPKVIEFEKKLSKKFNAKYCIVTSSGTSALKISVKALDLKKNSYIIVPSNTFVATANAVSSNNHKILLAPVNPRHGSVDFDSFLKTLKIAKKRKIKIKAFINVFFAGQVWDLEKIYRICKKEKIFIIDDACHAIGTKYKLKKKLINVGSCKQSSITTFSFHSIKNITTAEGGCILTNDIKIFDSAITLRSHGINRKLTKSKINRKNFITQPWFYEATTLSENYRLSDLQCSLGISQLKKIEKFKKIKDKLQKYYIFKIKTLSHYIKPIDINKDCNSHWHLFPILINNKFVNYKKKLYHFLQSKKINTQVHYVPIYKHPIYKSDYLKELHSDTEKFYAHTLSLPFHTKITISDIDFIIKNLSNFFKKLDKN
tara:strand:- start:1865 stop:3067 length:1203 start_codon:yes stop_codon:yes gene_type:complete